MRYRIGTLAIALMIIGTPARGRAQTQVDTIQGRITTDSGRTVTGADIIVTRAPDRMGFRAVSDSSGFYRIIIAEGTGDYLVHISATGRDTFRKRVLRGANGSTIVVDAKLASAVHQLSSVQVTAQIPKPTREPPFGAGIGAAEKVADGVTAAIPPDAAGDLAAIAGSIPGVSPQADGGFSVLGLGSQQNAVTLDGMGFSGASLPRDVRTRTRVSTSTFDPARGWFSGAQVNVELASGTLFTGRHMHMTVDAPALQYTDATSARLGSQYTNLNASIGGEGPLTNADTYFYNYGIQGTHRTASAPSLLNSDGSVLQRAGVSADSAARIIAALRSAGVPLNRSGIPTNRNSDQISLVARFDHAPYDWKTFSPAKSTWGITTFGNLDHAGQLRASATRTPDATGSSTDWLAGAQAMYSTYVGNDWLSDLRTAYSVSDKQTTPYLRLPSGRVLLASDFPDGTGGLTTLQFGGNGALETSLRQWTWETTSETQLFTVARSVHHIKVNFDSRLDGYAQDPSTNRYGTFFYNSAADLGTGNPASFARDLNTATRSGGEWNGFVSLGDTWRFSDELQFTYGARLEGNRFTSVPGFNPVVAQIFGERTDRAPNTAAVSPRLGFTWVLKSRSGIRITPLGSFNLGPSSYLRGGIGKFRNMLSPTLLSVATNSTGVAGESQRLFCLGTAVPTADWTAYAASATNLPTECAVGGAAQLSNSDPTVNLFDQHYTAPESWRANLAYSSVYRKLAYTLEGIYSLNLNQSGWSDLNFSGSPKFTLPAEGGRPIFVNTQDIVPVSGFVSPSSARESSMFGSVVSNQSIDRSKSRQLTLTVSPNLSDVSNWLLSGSYTLSSTRELTNGFDRTTFASPVSREWARGALDARHQLLVQAGYSSHGLAVTMFGRIMSGTPFTPLIATDVNGDGLSNDRAFIFDPARMPGTTLATDLDHLLSTSRNVRNCLSRQFGQVSGANSCEGPWTSALNMQLNASGSFLHSGRLTNVSVFFSNPLGGLDQLLHGSNNMRGWGTPAYPDPVLYNVRGFDPASREFNYVVNPRFGDTRPANTAFRIPFAVTIDFAVNLSRSVQEQQLDRSLRPGRSRPGPRLGVDDLKRRYARLVLDPFRSVLSESDSLLLSRDQVDSLQRADARYRVSVDSVWTELATFLNGLGESYDAAAALRHQEASIDDVWEISRVDIRRELKTILTPIQLTLLPAWPAKLYKMNERAHATRNTF